MLFRRTRPPRLGFRIEAYLALQQWRPLTIDADIPLTAVATCPADDRPLRTLCTLVSGVEDIRVRVGCCPECGHVTYIDRPEPAWIRSYYLSTWDTPDLVSRVERRRHKLAATLPKPKTGVTIAARLDVDRDRPVCEIGCGYGASLKHLANAGFTRLVGIEPSVHRGAVARDVSGGEVITAPFESPEARAALMGSAPFSIIYSHHALEHTFDPGAVLAAASALQRDGDYLILSVPNHEQEPSMGVLLFLPHLHSFTRASLERLAARFGYALFDDSLTHPKNLNLAFRKVACPVPPPRPPARPFEAAVAKYVRALNLRRGWVGRRVLWWHCRADEASQVSTLVPGGLGVQYWKWLALRRGWTRHRSALVSSLRPRATSVVESPLEIQFRGRLQLLYK